MRSWIHMHVRVVTNLA